MNKNREISKNRRLLHNFLFGNPQSKALAMLMLEGKLDTIEFLEKEIEDLKNEFYGSSKEGDNKARTFIEKGKGYLIFYGEKIPIGDPSSGKFKLLEALGNDSFGVAKTLDSTFENVKPKKSKNNPDTLLEGEYLGKTRKMSLLKSQVKEINRAIKEYVRIQKIKKFPYRITIKEENNAVLLSKRYAGTRG